MGDSSQVPKRCASKQASKQASEQASKQASKRARESYRGPQRRPLNNILCGWAGQWPEGRIVDLCALKKEKESLWLWNRRVEGVHAITSEGTLRCFPGRTSVTTSPTEDGGSQPSGPSGP